MRLMQYDICNVTNKYEKSNRTNAMWQIQCDKCNVAIEMLQMLIDKFNVTNAMWKLKHDKCN